MTMTIHIRLLPLDLQRQVLSHAVFRDALLVARSGIDLGWLAMRADELQARESSDMRTAEAMLHMRRGTRDTRMPTLWGQARRCAHEALAAACGRMLILRRIESLSRGIAAIRALEHELQSYCTDQRWVHRHPPVVLPASVLRSGCAALAAGRARAAAHTTSSQS